MRIVHLDDWLLALDKPAGLLVHRSAIARQAIEFALQSARQAVGRRVWPVHRLDRPTSGVLLLALSADVAGDLAAAFAAGAVAKRYLAIVRGHTPEQALIDHPLAHQHDVTTDARARSGKAAQPAVTGYRRLAAAELPIPVGRYASARYSLLSVVPQTGRRHQIRRHLKHVFHPVIGDSTHGDGRHNAMFRDRLGCSRLLLHALELRLAHPVTGEPLRLVAPPDRVFADVMRRLGWGAVAVR